MQSAALYLNSMKLLIDTNVILDVLLKREPFYSSSAKILNLSKQDYMDFYVSASAITDIFYIAYQAMRDMTIKKQKLRYLNRKNYYNCGQNR